MGTYENKQGDGQKEGGQLWEDGDSTKKNRGRGGRFNIFQEMRKEVRGARLVERGGGERTRQGPGLVEREGGSSPS